MARWLKTDNPSPWNTRGGPPQFPEISYNFTDRYDVSGSRGIVEGNERGIWANVVCENVASFVGGRDMAAIVREIGNLDVDGNFPEHNRWLVCAKDLSTLLFHLRNKKKVVIGREPLEILWNLARRVSGEKKPVKRTAMNRKLWRLRDILELKVTPGIDYFEYLRRLRLRLEP